MMHQHSHNKNKVLVYSQTTRTSDGHFLEGLTAEGDQPQRDHDGVSQLLFCSSSCRRCVSERSAVSERSVFMRPSWVQTCRRLSCSCRNAGPPAPDGMKVQRSAGDGSINPQVPGSWWRLTPAAPRSPPRSSLRSSELQMETSGWKNRRR